MIQEIDPALGMAMNLSPDWSEMTKPHPTRDEWHERQLLMPPGMRAMIDSYLTEKNAERAAELAREEAKAKTLRDRLAGFEIALREVIAGAEWLALFRESNPVEMQASKLTDDHRG